MQRSCFVLLGVFTLSLAHAQEAQRITITGSSAPSTPSVAGFGGDVPLARTPMAAAIVGESQRRDDGQRSLADLTRSDASLADAYNAEGYWSFLTIRGFTLDNKSNYRRDGLPINAETALALDNKASLEVIKGTSGIQAGTSAPGGLVNLVVKRPQRGVRSAFVEARQGGSVLGAVDLGDRFGVGDAFGWRLNAAAEHLDPLARSAKGSRQLLALAADARIGRDTLIEVEIESSHQRQPSVPGFSLLGLAVPDARAIDPRINLNNQAWSLPVVFDGRTASLRLTQALAEGWRARVHAMTQHLRTDDRIAFPFGCSAEVNFDRYCSDGSFDLYDFRSEGERRRTRALDASLEGESTFGGVKQHLSIGVLATRFTAELPPQAFNFAGTGRIDGSVQTPAAPLPLFDVTGRSERSTEAYLRDRIELTPNAQLWLGLRRSSLARDGFRQSFTTPWLAATWRADDHTTVYASWGRGVETEAAPNLPLYTNAARALPALESRQLEAGIKHARDGFDASLIGFSITRPQSGDFGACNADATCTRALDGDAVHRGLEAQIGLHHGAWRAQAGAMALHARRQGSATAALNGLEPVNVPARSLRAELGWSPWAGAELSAALAHESSRFVLPDHSAGIPGWTRLALGAKAEQRWGDTRIIWRAAIDNATDRRAWKESPYQFGHAYLFPLAPRSLRLSAQFEL